MDMALWPWKRVHVDFATSEEKHYLVLVPEVVGPTAAAMSVLSNLFTGYGFTEKVVSENGPPFQSKEYGDFLKLNGIQQMLVSPYHPAANGQAEHFVQTFKKFLQASELKEMELNICAFRTFFSPIVALSTLQLAPHPPNYFCRGNSVLDYPWSISTLVCMSLTTKPR